MKVTLRAGKEPTRKSSGMIKGGFIKFSFNFPLYIHRIKNKKTKMNVVSCKELDGY